MFFTCIFFLPDFFATGDRHANVKAIYFKTRVRVIFFFSSITDGKGRLRGFVTHINKGYRKKKKTEQLRRREVFLRVLTFQKIYCNQLNVLKVFMIGFQEGI